MAIILKQNCLVWEHATGVYNRYFIEPLLVEPFRLLIAV